MQEQSDIHIQQMRWLVPLVPAVLAVRVLLLKQVLPVWPVVRVVQQEFYILVALQVTIRLPLLIVTIQQG
jgi:hypothetical protein